MTGFLRTVVVALAVVVASTVAVSAGEAPEPVTVTIESGPTTEKGFVPPCTDVLPIFFEATSFVLTREQADGDLAVAYVDSGTAQAGIHYAALPGEVVFPDGDSTTTIQIEPLDTDDPELVELTLTLEASDQVAPGDPGAATITFATEGVNPNPCPLDFAFTDARHNTRQELLVGDELAPFEVELELTGERQTTFGPDSPESLYQHSLVDGALPSGIVMGCADQAASGDPCSHPQPQGTATTPGTSTATIEVCAAAMLFHCETTVLTVAVTEELPETGVSALGLMVATIAALAAGSGLLATQRRRPGAQVL